MISTLSQRLKRTPLSYFLSMLVVPARTIERVLMDPPSFWSLVLFLTVISLLRGFLDGALALLTDGQLFSMWHAGWLLPWFALKATPLLVADWLAVYVRWIGFALVPYVLGRFCGGSGRMADLLRLYGIILGVYVVTVLFNFAYFIEPLPMLRFEAAAQFKPTLGIGQVLTSSWLAWVTYLVVRLVHRLPRFEAVAIGILTPVLNIAALVLPGAVIFNLPRARIWGEKEVTNITLLGFSVVALLVIAGFGLIAWRLHSRATRHSSAT